MSCSSNSDPFLVPEEHCSSNSDLFVVPEEHFHNSPIPLHNFASLISANTFFSSNSDPLLVPEEPGAFSIATNRHNDTTSHLHNHNRGGSRSLGQADLVCPDASSDVGSHVDRNWLTRRFHPPDNPQG